ncbi:hypothetical protein SDJN02_22314, partial [Cucurbita argyrosperma subsp. argyrosperma]
MEDSLPPNTRRKERVKASDEIRRQSKLLNSGESELDEGRTAELEKEKTKGIGKERQNGGHFNAPYSIRNNRRQKVKRDN